MEANSNCVHNFPDTSLSVSYFDHILGENLLDNCSSRKRNI